MWPRFSITLRRCPSSSLLHVSTHEHLHRQILTLPKVFYLRILRDPMLSGRSVRYLRNSRILLWALAVFITCFATAYGFILVFQCSPVSDAWTQFAATRGHCLSSKTLEIGAYLHSGINGTLDLLLAFLPVPFFWKMELRWKMKLSILSVLCIGALYVSKFFVRQNDTHIVI